MNDNESQPRSWRAYRPSKGVWFWSCVASSAATMLFGFTWGGWTTSSGAASMAQTAVQTAEAELAASICVSRFERAADAATELATLKRTSYWERGDFIRRGNWLELPGMKVAPPGAASICVDRLMNADLAPGKTTTMDKTPG